MVTIFNNIASPDGVSVEAIVTCRLVAGARGDRTGYDTSSNRSLSGESVVTTQDGYWTLDVVPNDEIMPADSYYEVTERHAPGDKVTKSEIVVSSSATDPVWIGSILREGQ